MAARRKAEEALEQRSHTDGQQAESSKERETQEECSEATSSVLEGSRHALSIIYVGNEPPEREKKRKMENPDQHARPRKFVPQAPTLATLAKLLQQPVQSPSASPHLARPPSGLAESPQGSPSSALQSEVIYPNERVPQRKVPPTQPEVSLTGGKATSSSTINDLDTESKGGKEDPRADANGGKVPMALTSQTVGPSDKPARQPFLPLKFAPKPSSRLCNKRKAKANTGAEVLEKQKEQPND